MELRRKMRVGPLLMAAGLLLVLCAAALAGYNLWDGARAGREATRVLEQLPQALPDSETPEETPEYLLNPQMEMPLAWVDGYAYVGRLEIPDLGLTLPVMDEWTEAGAKIAPCRYAGSAYLDNLVIAGHNYSGHLQGVEKLEMGAEVRFSDLDGNLFSYAVTGIETLNPTQVEEMVEKDGWDLTIFTCNYDGSVRLAVRCGRAEAVR